LEPYAGADANPEEVFVITERGTRLENPNQVSKRHIVERASHALSPPDLPAM